MDWAIAGLTGRILLLGVERIVVKKLGTGDSPFCGAFVLFFAGVFFQLPLALVTPPASWAFLPGMTLAGLVYAVAFAAYVHSLAHGEASLVSPLYNFNLFFLALMAWFFLGEGLGWAKLGGLALLVVGAAFLKREGSILASWKALVRDRPCQFMVLASMLIAVGRIIDKSSIGAAPPMVYACLLYLCISAWLFLFLLATGRTGGLVGFWREKRWVSLAAGAVNGLSYPCLLLAMQRFEVSVVEPVSMLGMLVTLLFARFHLGEELGSRVLAALLMIAGACCLFFPS